MDLEFADTLEIARARALEFREVDPFPEIYPSLLSSADIEDYIRVTAMIHPFNNEDDRLKAASYEIMPGGRIIYWDEYGTKIEEKYKRNMVIIIYGQNSISFIQNRHKIYTP